MQGSMSKARVHYMWGAALGSNLITKVQSVVYGATGSQENSSGRRPRGKWVFFFFLMKLRLMRKWLTWQVRHSLLIGVPYPFLYYYWIPTPYLSRLLPNKYLCSVPMLTLWGIIYQHLLRCFGGEAWTQAFSYAIHTLYYWVTRWLQHIRIWNWLTAYF